MRSTRRFGGVGISQGDNDPDNFPHKFHNNLNKSNNNNNNNNNNHDNNHDIGRMRNKGNKPSSNVRMSRRASACLAPHISNVSNVSADSNNLLSIHSSAKTGVGNDDWANDVTNLDYLGELACSLVEATGYQFCAKLRHADQEHLRNVLNLLSYHNTGSSSSSSVGDNEDKDHDRAAKFKELENESDFHLYCHVMRNECVFMFKVAGLQKYESVHSLQQHQQQYEQYANTDSRRNKRAAFATDAAAVARAAPLVSSPGENQYVCVIRRTNMPLFPEDDEFRQEDGDMEDIDDINDINDNDEEENYDDSGHLSTHIVQNLQRRDSKGGGTTASNVDDDNEDDDESVKASKHMSRRERSALLQKKFFQAKKVTDALPYGEASSTPYLLCLTLSDSLVQRFILNPNKMKKDKDFIAECINSQPFDCIQEFVDLVKVDRANHDKSSICHLFFRTGETVEIETLDVDEQLVTAANMISQGSSAVSTRRASMGSMNSATESLSNNNNYSNNFTEDVRFKTEKFLWGLIQLHSILCGTDNDYSVETGVELQPSKHIDLSKLHYNSAVNGYFHHFNPLFHLVQRVMMNEGATDDAFDVDRIFMNIEEEKHAEEVLNSHNWQNMSSIDLVQALKDKMQLLEKEACERLIDWEDDKLKNKNNIKKQQRNDRQQQDIVELYRTLDDLDAKLLEMQTWLQKREHRTRAFINECLAMETENKALLKQWDSFKKLGGHLQKLLDDTDIQCVILKNNDNGDDVGVHVDCLDVLSNPRKYFKSHTDAEVAILVKAGKALKDAMDSVRESNALHLRAIYERGQDLTSYSDKYCSGIVHIIKEFITSKGKRCFGNSLLEDSRELDTHKDISKLLRNAQRKYHASLLMLVPLVEILTHLQPSAMSSLRDAYSSTVADRFLSHEIMQAYFSSLPSPSSSSPSSSPKMPFSLQAYSPASLLSASSTSSPSPSVTKIQQQQKDYIRQSSQHGEAVLIALNEVLSVIVREAFFTSAFFRLARSNMDGRTKRANFDTASKCVDVSSYHYRTQLMRRCGLGSLSGNVSMDPMVAFVSSTLLHRTMNIYLEASNSNVSRNTTGTAKKGGDHSLSLAYIRSTILDLRQQVDKNWGDWMDKQIKWVQQSLSSLPKDGKKVGILPAFVRFPSYLDHIIGTITAVSINNNKMTDKFSFTNDDVGAELPKMIRHYLHKLATALFESLHKYSSKEGIDQSYVANILRMENSYYFFLSVQSRPQISSLFNKQSASANSLCKVNLASYINYMIKREFKQLFIQFAAISKARRDVGDAKQVSTRISKKDLVDLLSAEAGREKIESKIRKIYSRCKKHLCKESTLLYSAWKALVKELWVNFDRWGQLGKQCYDIVMEPNAIDVVRLAKSIGEEGDQVHNSTSSNGGAVGVRATMSLTGRR